MDKLNNKVGPLTRIGCFVIGWNPTILKECGEASHRALKRYISALTILIIIWGTIGFCFAERYIGIESILGNLAVSAVFVTVIICIERYIILTGRSNFMTFMRIVIAFLMAVLGSTIFDQIIFKNDVDVKMKEIRTDQILKEIPKRISYFDSDIKRVTNLIDSISRENINIYANLAQKPVIETTDVSTTTHQTGVDDKGNPIIEKVTNISKRNIENPLAAQAKANEQALRNYQTQLSEYQKQKMEVGDIVRKEYEEAHTGFLEELQALISLLLDSMIALMFYLFLLSFLISLEILVVASKNSDAMSDYDLVVDHQLNIRKITLQKTEKKLMGD